MRVANANWRHFDFWLLGAVAVLVIFGITMIRSAVAGNIELTTETNLVNRQLLFAVIGFAVIILTASIDYHLWSSIAAPCTWAWSSCLPSCRWWEPLYMARRAGSIPASS